MDRYIFLYIGTMTTIVVCGLIYKSILYRRRSAKLGKLIYGLKKERQRQGLYSHSVRAFVTMAVAVYFIVDRGGAWQPGLFLLTVFLSVMLVQFSVPLLMYARPYGIYENGAVTVTGAILYDSCRNFGFNRSSRGALLLVLQTRFDLMGGGSYLYIEEFERKKYEKYLLKKCQYQEFR